MATKNSKPHLEEKVAAQLKERGIPFRQHIRFQPRSKLSSTPHHGRLWECDFLFTGRVVLEVEGGVWSGGRHTRPAGFSEDVEKYNAFAEEGYRVFKATPQTVRSGKAVATIGRVLGYE